MCRMLGIVASEPTDFRFCLHSAPRSLCTQSVEHPHGWGVAIYDAGESDWVLHKQPACASEDARFHGVAVGTRGHSLVAHIRKRTVGPVGLENTHPFRRGRWIFAHNGTITDMDLLREGCSKERLGEVSGSTDSELFFARILSLLDERGGAETVGADTVASTLELAAKDWLASPRIGAANFLLSNGDELYAYRRGRSLYALRRDPGDEVLPSRRSEETGAVIDTYWTARRKAVLVASEAISDEPWVPVEEGVLMAVTRHPEPSLSVLYRG